jgi:hypothetical protein
MSDEITNAVIERKEDIKMVYFKDHIDDFSAAKMMDLLNDEPYTRIIHTTFIRTENIRLFILKRTNVPYIKCIGRQKSLYDAVNNDGFIICNDWLVGNIPTNYQIPKCMSTDALFEEMKKMKGLMQALTLSFIKLEKIPNFTSSEICITYNYSHNIFQLTS